MDVTDRLRISSLNSTTTALTDEAVKIYRIPFCHYALITPDEKVDLYNGYYGFTYAGNVNVAMQVYSVINFISERIRSVAFEYAANSESIETLLSKKAQFQAPSFKRIADIAGQFLLHYVKSFGSIIAHAAQCEIALFGYCPTERKMKTFHIHIENENSKLDVKIIDFDLSTSPLCLGSGAKQANEILQKNTEKALKVIREIVADEKSRKLGIGGHIQAAWAYNSNVQIISTLTAHDGANYLGFPIHRFIDESNMIDMTGHAFFIQ